MLPNSLDQGEVAQLSLGLTAPGGNAIEEGEEEKFIGGGGVGEETGKRG
jgi:hypothetical protein